MKLNYNYLTAFLGVVIGVLATLILLRRPAPILLRRPAPSEHTVMFDGDYNQWRKLNLMLQQIGNEYVDTIDMEAMTDAAITAALAKLDPHSLYLPPVELEEAEDQLAGNFEGIGITFNVPGDTAIVLNVIPGGPSEKAGLIPGDRIIKVDAKVIAGTKTPQDSMVKLMRGPAGTKVDILINRDGTSVPFEITRGKIPQHSVDAAFMIDDRTGYIKLAKFSRTTSAEFIEASQKLVEAGMEKLIFDLRGNTGGYFDQALLISNEFLRRGDGIVYMEGRNRKREQYDADGDGQLQDIELVVLIDESSASSSEIFAGAIQDNDRGLVVGRRSFGKGLVQEPIYFTDGSGLRLTVARFHTPSGRCIQKPYDGDYAYDIIDRYAHGEMLSADSIKVDTTAVYLTAKGRKVYGGGGIIPDVFVPIDTTLATNFHIQCNKKATSMRFASVMFDRYKSDLSKIDNFADLEAYLGKLDVEGQFLAYAAKVDGIRPKAGEWEETREYLMPQVLGLVGRYSKVGEEAFYRFFMPLDEEIQTALNSQASIQ